MGNQTTKQSGKDKPKKNVHWKTAEPPSPPGKPVLVPGTPDTAPDIVTIRWLRPQSDGGSPILGYLVEHRRTGSPHWVRATATLIPLTQLSLTGLEPGWRYQFRVIAENAIGKSDCSEISDPLTVTLQRNAITPPKFTHEIYDTTAVENEKVEFRVSVAGTPVPQISWFKDGFEIFSSRRTKIVNESDVSVLVIHQAALTDEGEIKCSATNRAGHVVTRAHLSIEAFPKIRLPRQYEDGLILEAEEVVRLKVGLAGRPAPVVYWTHNGEELVDGPRYELSTNDKNSTLKISQSQRDDRGEYGVRAVNKLGEDNASFLVTITARPEAPGKVMVNMTLGKSVTISWTPPVDDGGCKIGNYIVEYFRIGWNVWLKVATCRQLSTTLNDLIEGSEYKFRVKAENPYGLSDPSEDSDVLFIADPKRGITDPDKIKAVELEENSTAPTAVPRKRRDLSKSPGRDLDEDKPTKKIKPFSPEIFDHHELQRDMSYGAAEEFFKYKENTQNNLLLVSKGSDEMHRSTSPIPEVIVTTDFPSEERLGQRRMPEKMDTDESNQLTAKNKNKPTGHSSEFMLVLYDQGSKTNARNTHFDFELDELVAPPPPLSLSAPDLSLEPPHQPAMRPAVSSTELLYERAMARFYQAVAYEESENARKERHRAVSTEEVLRRRSFSMDHQHQKLRKLSGGKELLQIQKRSSMSESSEQDEIHSDYDKKEVIEANNNVVEASKVEAKLSDVEMAEEDEEEESSEDSVIEEYHKLDQKIRTIKHDEPEEDTYHPSYTPQDPSQAVEVLTKPLRLPNPNFVPKPILKRPSTEVLENKASAEFLNVPKEITPIPSSSSSLSSIPTPSIVEEKKPEVVKQAEILEPVKTLPKKLDSLPKKLEPFKESPEKPESAKELSKKEKKKLKEEEKKLKEEEKKLKEEEKKLKEEEKKREKEEKKRQSMNQSERISLKKLLDFSPFGKNNKEKKEDEKSDSQSSESQIPPAESVKAKRMLQKQNSEEEYHAVANFYGDIVREMSSPLRREVKVPLYLNPQRLQQIEVSDEEPEPKPIIPEPPKESPIKELPPKKLPKVEPKKPEVQEVKMSKPTQNVENRKFVVVENNVHAPVAPTENVAFTEKTVPKKKTVRSSSKTRKPLIDKDKVPDGEPVKKTRRAPSKTRMRSASKSPSRIGLAKPVITTNQIEPEVVVVDGEVSKVKQVRIEEVIVHDKVKTTLAYFTDISLFLLACWLYIFKKPILAVPVLMLIVYRNIQDIIKERMPDWLKFS